VMIDVTGAQDLLGDRRLVSVIRRALAFKRVDGATISLSADDRLAVDLGEPIYALINGTAFTSREPVGGETLADLETANIGFAGYLAEDQAAS
jgi:hypothetical protein